MGSGDFGGWPGTIFACTVPTEDGAASVIMVPTETIGGPAPPFIGIGVVNEQHTNRTKQL